MGVDLGELRKSIGWVDRAAFQAAWKRLEALDAEGEQLEDRVRRGERAAYGGPRQIFTWRARSRLPALTADLEQVEGDLMKMFATDASLRRPGDTLQVVHLRDRLEPVKQRASNLLDLAERSGGWVRAERLRRVHEQLPEIERLTGLIRRLEAAAEGKQ